MVSKALILFSEKPPNRNKIDYDLGASAWMTIGNLVLRLVS
ncbi:MAG: hypothetical protein H6Q71_1045, partial [Firmicutes bacterium]|nr:hypothetical protein [Bacillota bacterium]